jgi:hypothetical protein
MSPRVGVNRQDHQIKLFLPEHLSWQCSTDQTGGDDRSDRSSTRLHKRHRLDRWALSGTALGVPLNDGEILT